MPEVSITATPKFTDISFAQQFGKDLLTNPPKTPVAMLGVMGKALDFSGTLSKGLSAVFPFAAPILPILGGIFDLFSGPPPGPTFEELTLESIGKVSQQIAEGFETVLTQTQEIAEAQATRTINAVVSGVQQIAGQQSAAEILENVNELEILNNLENKKLAIYKENQNILASARQEFVDTVGNAMRAAKQKSDLEYSMIQAQVAQIAGSVFTDIQKTIDSAAADANEIYEIEKQILEIKTVIETGQLAAIAKTLVMRYLGIK